MIDATLRQSLKWGTLTAASSNILRSSVSSASAQISVSAWQRSRNDRSSPAEDGLSNEPGLPTVRDTINSLSTVLRMALHVDLAAAMHA